MRIIAIPLLLAAACGSSSHLEQIATMGDVNDLDGGSAEDTDPVPYSINPAYVGPCPNGTTGVSIGVKDPEGKEYALRVCHPALELKQLNGVTAAIDTDGTVLITENAPWIGEAVHHTADNPYQGPNGIIAFRLY